MKWNPFLLIPGALSVAVLFVFPLLLSRYGARGLVIGLVAIAWPWLMYFIISRGVDHVVSKEVERHRSEDNQDFV